MRAPPGWWLDKPDMRARLLQPLGTIYGAITATRMKQTGTQAPVPVICIGNFIAGGAGKTPTAIAIGKMLQAKGERIAFLSRGYGGTKAGTTPLQVVAAQHKAADVGDEPLLLARVAPTFICTDRVAGAQAAAQAGASLVILDDGLQNPHLAKDLRIAVVDAEAGIGNKLCMPAGPLRAPMDAQWPHVDALVVIGEGARGRKLAEEARKLGKAVFHATLAPDNADEIHGKKLAAFAGIGRPEKFFGTLRDLGGDLAATQAFADHHPYSRAELDALQQHAHANAAGPAYLVTTEKDAIRIEDGVLPGLIVLRVALAFDAPEKLDALIAEKINRA